MFSDRNHDTRLAKLSKETCRAQDSGPSALSMSIDGMDQAKFRIPRNTVATKEKRKVLAPSPSLKPPPLWFWRLVRSRLSC